jgi:flagellar biosynthetic protein FliR
VETFEVPLKPFLVFLVVLARVGGMVTFAPFWANRVTSPKIKIVLAFAMALALTPLVITKIDTPPSDQGQLVIVLIGELLIGLTFGFVGRLVFGGIEMAAYLISSQMGFSLAGTIDPTTQAQTTAFGIIGQMLGLMVLLSVDGHHWFLTATVRSFSLTAPGTFELTPQLLDLLIQLSANALVVGITLAAPAVIVLLVIEFALEFFGRTAPQFQVFILGFPIKIAVGFAILGATMYFIPGAIRDVLSGIYDGLGTALGAM